MRKGYRNENIVVVSDPFTGDFKQPRLRVRVRCDCGREYEVDARFVKNGKAKRCRSCAGKLGAARSHGFRSDGKREDLYVKWAGMRSRCFNKNDKDYKNFGGRGIKICSTWLQYGPFRSWAIKSGYKKGFGVYRKNTDKDYSPSNCFTSKYRPMEKLYQFRGKKYSLAELYKMVGSHVPLPTVKKRLSKGWELLEALLRPTGLKIR